MDTNRDNDAKEMSAPPKLIAALKRTQSSPIFVPRTMDETILRTAKEHIAPSKSRAIVPLWLRWLSFASACLLLVAIAYRTLLPRPDGEPSGTFAAEDLNHDGQVDVLDALQLAQQAQSGARPTSGPDLNGDGVVDRRDAEIIATHAVKLEKGGRS